MTVIRALGSFGVYRLPAKEVLLILALADEFRQKLCDIYQDRHNQTIDFRNRRFPRLFAAMVESESLYWKVIDVEKAIKAHHSDVRDRNAVTKEQRILLETLREKQKIARAAILAERKPWNATLRAFQLFWRNIRNWKIVKSLPKRKVIYDALKFPVSIDNYLKIAADEEKPLDVTLIDPAAIEEYGRMWMALDLRERDLFSEYQAKGLHSAIRGEIVDASVPKLKDDQPGMRYRYGKKPEPRPWEKITLQIVGGASFEKIQSGLPSLELTQDEGIYYFVRQAIGTVDKPVTIEYRVIFDKGLPPPDVMVNRWTLCIRRVKTLVHRLNGQIFEKEKLEATAIPVVAFPSFSKPMGHGTFGYDLTWTVKRSGVQVCTFLGEHVNESLVIPWWLVNLRMEMKDVQVIVDAKCNAFLIACGKTPKVNERQGFVALLDWCVSWPLDNEAANLRDDCLLKIGRARRDMKQAVRCIETLYETVAFRVCSLHAAIVNDPIDLSKIKRYDTRDLLRIDVLPERSREIMHVVAPGKLKALLQGYGLVASDDVIDETRGPLAPQKKTDAFTSFVWSLANKEGGFAKKKDSCSQIASAVVTK